MRGVKIFSGRSHPALTEAICQRLGTTPAKCELGYFSNGETSVQIGTSVRNQDVFIVQSGSPKINDSVMELLIMIAACKGGSAKSITAVIPYFPYSRQCKKKSHRGAITAKMLANLVVVAGVDHVITVDLHATQMQGFFGKPVDNVYAEPLIARWIQSNVPGWQKAVAVSKNPAGTKRCVSLADALKLNFAIVSTDRKRPNNQSNMMDSAVFFDSIEPAAMHSRTLQVNEEENEADSESDKSSNPRPRAQAAHRGRPHTNGTVHTNSHRPANASMHSSPLVQTTRLESVSPPPRSPSRLSRVATAPSARRPSEYETAEGYIDERAREIITGRLIQGHIVDDDHPSPALSAMSASTPNPVGDRQVQDAMGGPLQDPMTSSVVSAGSSLQPDHALGGTFDAAATSEEEEEAMRNPELEQTITLVGQVRDKTVFLVDDMIDKSAPWIAAAETVVKKGGAKRVYCIATHGLLGDDSLEQMEACDCIDWIVLCNTFPLTPQRLRNSKKLVVIDVSQLLAESMRRTHFGESMSVLCSRAGLADSALSGEIGNCRV
jgi:ribose-phosphate pyrophosphokinase